MSAARVSGCFGPTLCPGTSRPFGLGNATRQPRPARRRLFATGSRPISVNGGDQDNPLALMSPLAPQQYLTVPAVGTFNPKAIFMEEVRMATVVAGACVDLIRLVAYE